MTKRRDKDAPSFEEFRDSANNAAARSQLLLGLGMDHGAPAADINAAVQAAVEKALKKSEIATTPAQLEAFREELKRLIESFREKVEQASDPSISMLDVVTLGFTTDEQIRHFLKTHGVDFDVEKDREYIFEVFRKAIDLLDSEVAEKENEKPGKHFYMRKPHLEEDIFKIFKVAAGYSDVHQLIPLACAVLRIAACVDYSNREPKIKLIPYVEKKLDEIEKAHIRRTQDGKLSYLIGDPMSPPIPLADFEHRTKTTDRIIAKLFRRPGNRINEVLDHIGYRFTTKSALDSLRIIYHLFFNPTHSVFPASTIIVGESRNRLFDPAKLLEILEKEDEAAARALVNGVAEDTVVSGLRIEGRTNKGTNKDSSEKYRAIHITFDFPLDLPDGNKASFPVELQILDIDSKIQNAKVAPHEKYEADQMDIVRTRALGNNLLTEFEDRTGKKRHKAT